jgi:hypothetical protein
MSSDRRIAASQANGRLSHGPKTPEGKQRSSLNAMRHGLCAAIIVLPGENPQGFHDLMEQYVKRFCPDEYTFIEEMAATYWRQRRGWCIETTLLKRPSMPSLLETILIG